MTIIHLMSWIMAQLYHNPHSKSSKDKMKKRKKKKRKTEKKKERESTLSTFSSNSLLLKNIQISFSIQYKACTNFFLLFFRAN